MEDSEEQPKVKRAEIIGDNGPKKDIFWFKSGLSLLTRDPVSPPNYLAEHEADCITASEITTDDLVIFFKGFQLYQKKGPNNRPIIDTSKLKLIRFGVAYTNAIDKTWVVSQDEDGKVWNHPIDELPSYSQDDWDYYGLHLKPQEVILRRTSAANQINPGDVIDTWLTRKNSADF